MSGSIKNFDDVIQAEYIEIHRRRGAQKGATGKPDKLFGVALSGGGIRSASFSLGALQALHLYGLIPKIDYLSTVSGGGYIGTSMIAAMTRQNEALCAAKADGASPPSAADLVFPFGASDNGGDCDDVKHLRDNSKFLAPQGLSDFGISAAIMLRGLMVNFLMLLSVMLPLATMIILANPTTAFLDKSLIYDMLRFYFPHINLWSWWPTVEPVLRSPFIMTYVSGAIFAVWLVGWAIVRSTVDQIGGARARDLVEPDTRGAWWGRRLLLLFVLALALELQPMLIRALIGLIDQKDGQQLSLQTLAAAAAIVTATATFQGRLIAWIERAVGSATVGAKLQAVLAKAAFYALGLALPLLLYGLFLLLVVWGMKIVPTGADRARGYAFGPKFLTGDYHAVSILAATAAIIILSWFIGSASPFKRLKARGWRRLPHWIRETSSSFLARFRSLNLKPKPTFAIASGLLFALLAVPAVRSAGGYVMAADGFAKPDHWVVLANFVSLSVAVIVITIFFGENSNSLHRLYRDRLQAAFRLGQSADGNKPLALHELCAAAPYLLVNGTLNVKRARDGQNSDPAKRGRNAEFFLFSRLFVGSDATGYVDSKEMARCEAQLDLATAAAISGAAVSSSMGRQKIGLLGPTLALLNLRLGFWLANPRDHAFWRAYRLGKLTETMRARRGWEDKLRLYLFNEAFGRLRSDSSRVYITDGGHLDNLGLYQLLKRRCKLIIVIDAEADPGLNFGAFCDVQRFVRIDDGTRIDLNWQPIRDDAIRRQADRQKRASADTLAQLRHFAIGRIQYTDKKSAPDGQAILLYIKAAMTGDEPDYLLDYERRNPQFPHESTGDQFFSEEQLESYRALGFHSVKRAFDGLEITDKLTSKEKELLHQQQELMTAMRKALGVTNHIDPRLPKPRKKRKRTAPAEGPIDASAVVLPLPLTAAPIRSIAASASAPTSRKRNRKRPPKGGGQTFLDQQQPVYSPVGEND